MTLLSPSVLYTFDSATVSHLRICYGSFIPHVNILEVPQVCWKYKAAKWWSQYLKSSEYPAKISTCILANWVGGDGQITEDSTVVWAGRVEYFLAKNCKQEMISINTLKLKWHLLDGFKNTIADILS